MLFFRNFLIVSLLLIGLGSPVWATEAAPEHASNSEHNAHEPRHKANLNLLPPHVPDASKSTRPEMVKIVSPTPLAKVNAGNVMLKWESAAGAQTYLLQVATDAAFKWLVVEEKSLSTTEYELKNIESGKQYFWRVSGLKSDNEPTYMKGFFSRSSFQVR